jgi:hypothetical protein
MTSAGAVTLPSISDVDDTDWGMHAIHGADPASTVRVVTYWAEHAVNGWVGRELPARFTDAGPVDQFVVAKTIITRDPRPPALQPFATMADFAARCGVLSAHEAQDWLDQLTDAGARGAFLWAVTMFAVAGTRHT